MTTRIHLGWPRGSPRGRVYILHLNLRLINAVKLGRRPNWICALEEWSGCQEWAAWEDWALGQRGPHPKGCVVRV